MIPVRNVPFRYILDWSLEFRLLFSPDLGII